MLKIRKLLLLLVGFGFFLMSSHAYPQESAGEDMLKRCEQEGAAAVVNQFAREDWDLLAEKVAAGDTSWIEAAACLNHGLYYGGKGDLIDDSKDDWGDYGWWVLTEAWGQALLKNPVAILRTEAGASLRGACRLPLEADEKSVEFADDFLAKALASLDKVKEDHFEVSKKVCQLYLTLNHERVIKRLHERNEEEKAGQ